MRLMFPTAVCALLFLLGPVLLGPAAAQSPSKTNPLPCTSQVVTTGSTAVIVATGPISGGYVLNPPNAASQGIATAENLYLDPVASPGSTDAAGNGTTSTMTPGQPYYIPPLAPGKNLLGNALTSGHKISCVMYQ